MQTPLKNLLLCVLLSVPVSLRAEDPPVPPPVVTASFAGAPHINGPSVFGVRPGSPCIYTIPATGERPVEFGAQDLPAGLTLDPHSGQITGSLKDAGEFHIVLSAKNALGSTQKQFRIVVGPNIALTPPMGWNSWNCWAEKVDQDKVLRSARALVSSGLANHGWTYINIDDTWQGDRSGPDHALQGNQKFPDMKGLCDEVHKLGLKPGIYSTPWITSYAKFPGSSSDDADGAWSKKLANDKALRLGTNSFSDADARQWAAWGFDYLKYDWFPNDVPHTIEMSKALRASGRDIIFSLSNTAPFDHAADFAQWANCWRTTCDIRDKWAGPHKESWQYSVSEIGFAQDQWAPYAGPGHWNDPDMLVIGGVGWGKPQPSHLTPDEQYTHISLWCLLSAPLLIGCDLEHMDDLTLKLLSNDDVLALDQDALGKQAVRVAAYGPVDVLMKELEDGSRALGFFNRDSTEQTIEYDKLGYLGFKGPQHVRDLWQQKDLDDLANPEKKPLVMTIPSHGVQLFKLTAIK